MNKPVAWMDDCSFFTEQPDDMEGVIPLYTHPVNPKYDPETGEPLIDGYPLFSGLPHPVKELHLSLQKSKQTGELLAVTYTDDEHRIVEVLWQKPPVKELTDEEINKIYLEKYDGHMGFLSPDEVREFARTILRKAQEK